jgi:CelD/BcsL family acetyltransferase involved in cellulose biosynthesis
VRPAPVCDGVCAGREIAARIAARSPRSRYPPRVQLLSVPELDAGADAFDAAVLATPGIDRFCSSSAWVVSAAEALMPARRTFIHRGGSGYLAAALSTHPSGLVCVEPLELAWGLASPLVGPDPVAIAEETAALLAASPAWRIALVAGIVADTPLATALHHALPAHWERRAGQPTRRHVASLAGGVDGFLSRRSRELRKGLRRAERRAALRGVVIEAVDPTTPAAAHALFDRVLAIEAASWKAGDGVGLSDHAFAEFYRRMAARLATRGRLRAMVARLGDRDVAYVLGAVFGGEYRGLQFSYADDLGDLSLGSLCQLRQIHALCAEGITAYDLGTDMDYKRRWAETQIDTELIVVVRR